MTISMFTMVLLVMHALALLVRYHNEGSVTTCFSYGGGECARPFRSEYACRLVCILHSDEFVTVRVEGVIGSCLLCEISNFVVNTYPTYFEIYNRFQ